MDENEFFREATLRICGSIEIEKALAESLDYLKRFIPADSIWLHYLKLEQKQGMMFAGADKDGGRILNTRFDHPEPIWRFIGDGKNLPGETLHNRADQHPLGKELMRLTNMTGKHSLMGIRLIMDQREIGVVGFAKKGWDHYNEKHTKLLWLLKNPFAIALSNSRRYFELLELKNLLADDNQYLQNELRQQTYNDVVGADFGLRQVMEKVHQVGPLSTPVLLLGETGTGKEVIANAIHNASSSKNGPFIKVNCGAIPESLIDSELFGHEKGAFTGAIEKRRGRFERAHGGSIFLDEVGELPEAAQLRLLRVLQDMEFEPVGGTESIKVDTRIIAATNRDLDALVEEGRFRRDLFFRLNVFPIHIPPLKERKCDIPALVQHSILNKYRKLGFSDYPALAVGALDKLSAYDWPGNVRELENAVEKAMIVSRGAPLQFSGLKSFRSTPKSETPDTTGPQTLILDEVIVNHIEKIMKMTDGKINGPNGAAEILGLHPATLRHRMRKLGIPFGRGANRN